MYTEQICKYIDANRENILNDIAALVNIPSTKGAPEEKMPFGKYPAEALNKALEMCRESGFAVKNISNAIGYADMNDLPLELGIFAHMDVVPAGDGWESNPFEMTYKDGYIFGRGVSDDKGPAVAALYAMKAVKDTGIPLKKNVRLILGSDEECGSADLAYYFESEKTPAFSFSPDAEFPLINTEKGRFAPKFSAKTGDEENCLPRVVFFESGKAVNAVPNSAVMKIVGISKSDAEKAIKAAPSFPDINFNISFENDILTVTSSGKAAHASLPEEGANALTALLAIVNNFKLCECKSTSLLKGLNRLFAHNDCYGVSCGIAQEDKISGKLTLSLDILHFDGETMCGCFDSRTPLCSTYENTAEPIIKALSGIGFEINEMNMTPPHHVDPELPFIKTLLSAYEKHTGKKGECVAIGGGTYVHGIENGVAFGSIMPDVNTNMHGANEYMPFEDIITAAKIYAEAIAIICSQT